MIDLWHTLEFGTQMMSSLIIFTMACVSAIAVPLLIKEENEEMERQSDEDDEFLTEFTYEYK